MGCNLQTGLTASSYQRYLRGPGKVYKDFTSLASPGTLLGATKGGTEFSWGLETFDIQPDGSLGLIKNHRVVNSCKPTMKVNLMEFTATTMLGSVPGGDTTNETPTAVLGEYLGTGAEVTIGVALGGGSSAGAVDESTLSVWYTDSGLGAPTLGVLGTDYTVVDQITCATIIEDDTISITDSAGVVQTYTGKDSDTQSSGEFETGTSDASTAASIAALINSAYGPAGITATSAAAIVSLNRAVSGTPNTLATSGLTATFEYQVILEDTGGSIVDADLVTASYTYDSAAGSGVYQILTPGCIEDGDYWDNVTLVCELSNPNYTYPYIVYQVKNCLPAPDPVSIPGEFPGETTLSVMYEGSFDPADGLTMADAPVEVWLGTE